MAQAMIENLVKYFSQLPIFFIARIAQIRCNNIINKAKYPEQEWIVNSETKSVRSNDAHDRCSCKIADKSYNKYKHYP